MTTLVGGGTGSNSVEVTGVKELLLKLQEIKSKTPLALANGQYEGMQRIMVDAKERAPKDTTAMAESGYVSPAEMTSGGDTTIKAGFGGESEEYVFRQHEDTSLRHPNGGEAHFFTNAIDAGQQDLEHTCIRHVETFLATGKLMQPEKIVPQSPTEKALGIGIHAAESHRSGG